MERVDALRGASQIKANTIRATYPLQRGPMVTTDTMMPFHHIPLSSLTGKPVPRALGLKGPQATRQNASFIPLVDKCSYLSLDSHRWSDAGIKRLRNRLKEAPGPGRAWWLQARVNQCPLFDGYFWLPGRCPRCPRRVDLASRGWADSWLPNINKGDANLRLDADCPFLVH